jgi:hypothetical protein
VEMDDEEFMFLMSWKRQVPRGTKCCLKIKITLSEKIGKIYTMKTEKRIKGIDENIMMACFKNIGAASALSRYSMLESTLFLFQNVDISR